MNYFTFVKNNWSSLGFPNYKSGVSAQKMKDAFRNRNDEPPPEVKKKKKKKKKHIEEPSPEVNGSNNMLVLPEFTENELRVIYMNHSDYKDEDKEWGYLYLLRAMNDGLREVPDVPENKHLKTLLASFVAIRNKQKTKENKQIPNDKELKIEPPPEVKNKKKKKHIEEPQEVKFKDKKLFIRAIETWFRTKGQRLTNLSKCTIDKLYSFIPKYDIDVDKLIDIYNEQLTTLIDKYRDDRRPHIIKKQAAWKRQYIVKNNI